MVLRRFYMIRSVTKDSRPVNPFGLCFQFKLGLGLQLCDWLGWSYTSREEDGLHRACIVFCETDPLGRRPGDDITQQMMS